MLMGNESNHNILCVCVNATARKEIIKQKSILCDLLSLKRGEETPSQPLV